MKIAHNLESDLIVQKRKNRELEEYLDLLLLRVMETHPKLLQNPYLTKTHMQRWVFKFHLWVKTGIQSNFLFSLAVDCQQFCPTTQQLTCVKKVPIFAEILRYIYKFHQINLSRDHEWRKITNLNILCGSSRQLLFKSNLYLLLMLINFFKIWKLKMKFTKNSTHQSTQVYKCVRKMEQSYLIYWIKYSKYCRSKCETICTIFRFCQWLKSRFVLEIGTISYFQIFSTTTLPRLRIADITTTISSKNGDMKLFQ